MPVGMGEGQAAMATDGAAGVSAEGRVEAEDLVADSGEIGKVV